VIFKLLTNFYIILYCIDEAKHKTIKKVKIKIHHQNLKLKEPRGVWKNQVGI